MRHKNIAKSKKFKGGGGKIPRETLKSAAEEQISINLKHLTKINLQSPSYYRDFAVPRNPSEANCTTISRRPFVHILFLFQPEERSIIPPKKIFPINHTPNVKS